MPRSPFRWTPRREGELLLDDEDDGAGAMLDDPTVTADAADERDFIAVSGGSWGHRLTRREKMLRGAGSALVVLVIALVLLGGPGSVLAYLANVALPFSSAPIAQAARNSSTADAIDVPVPADTRFNPQVTLAPANGPEPFTYACWVDEDPTLLGQFAGTLHVALFAVMAHNWTLISPPSAQSAGCRLIVDRTAPNHVILASAHEMGADGACRLPSLFHSEDRGAHWSAMSWPANAPAVCDVQLELEGNHLYALADQPLIPASALPRGAAGRLDVTADDGTTWASADDGLAGISSLALVAVRPNGRVLVQGSDPATPGVTTLWQSDDAGRHWRGAATVPGVHTQVFASSNPEDSSHGGWGRLYAYATAIGADAPLRQLIGGTGVPLDDGTLLATGFVEPPWTLSHLQLSGAVVPAWSEVAQPPEAAANGELPAGLWSLDASEGPNGSLIVARPDLGNKVLTVTPPFDLLLWNGTRWIVSQHVIPANARLQGVSWHQGVMRVWVTFKPGISRSVQLLTFTISPADLG